MRVKTKIIKDTRLQKDYTQDYIADLLGISQSKYSKLEKGEITFAIDELSKLLDILELNPMEVIDFTEKQKGFIDAYNKMLLATAGNVNPTDEELIRKIVNEEINKNYNR